MTLDILPVSQRAVITGIAQDEGLGLRMRAFGLRVGREVMVVRRSRIGGPLQVRVGTTDVIMRIREATLIRVEAPTR